MTRGLEFEPQLVTLARKRAVAALDWACPATRESLMAHLVSQGRQFQKGYWGCADLAHWMLHDVLGLRSEHINRDDPATKPNEWRVGQNVSLLAFWRDVAVVPQKGLSGVDGADVLIRWNKSDASDAHVVCVTSQPFLAKDGKTWLIGTAEFGQGADNVDPQETIGKHCIRECFPKPGQRKWRVWLPIPLVIEECKKNQWPPIIGIDKRVDPLHSWIEPGENPDWTTQE